MRFVLAHIALVATIGCGGGDFSNCEYTLNGVTVCEEANVSMAFCRSDRGGEPTRVDDGDAEDVFCADMGYTVACAEVCLDSDGVNQCGSELFYVGAEEDCATAFPEGQATL